MRVNVCICTDGGRERVGAGRGERRVGAGPGECVWGRRAGAGGGEATSLGKRPALLGRPSATNIANETYTYKAFVKEIYTYKEFMKETCFVR